MLLTDGEDSALYTYAVDRLGRVEFWPVDVADEALLIGRTVRGTGAKRRAALVDALNRAEADAIADRRAA